MNKSILVFTLAALLLNACSSSSAVDKAGTMVAETVSAAPTIKSAQPAATFVPQYTPAQKPTATANIALTTTVEAFDVLSELDVNIGANSGIPYGKGYLAWKQNEPVTIFMNGPQRDAGLSDEIDRKMIATNFIFKSDVTWNASGVLICGVIFRSDADLAEGKQYQFYFYRLSGLPVYLIDVYEFGRHKYSVSDAKYSDTLNFKNDGTNQFLLIAQEEAFDVYINGKHQGRFIDESLQRPSEGVFGFVGWQDSGNGTCKFENSWIWVLTE